MNAIPLYRRLLHIPRRMVRESLMVIQLVRFFLVNRLSRKDVIEPSGPVVSLTTHGKRCKTVYFAIESMACGELRPSRLILWIDDEALFNKLPPSIHRLQKRGLEVKRCRNYGPHTKYYPYLESQESFAVPLVTADDDMLYPPYWLKRLSDACRAYPEFVNCFWGHVMAVTEYGIGDFFEWRQINSTRPSFCHHAAGVTGVIYPQSFLAALKQAGTGFKACCPKADDVWLHVQGLRNGFKVRAILSQLPYYSFRGIPGTRNTGLCLHNVDGPGNDLQIRATYNASDIRLLLAD